MNPINFFLSLLNTIAFSHLYIKGKVIPGFVPSKEDLVIDLGSGDKPFWRADVCLDKISLGNEQRFSSTKAVQDVGIFVNGDIAKTPFNDKSFGFSYCSHVLEHVENPELAIREIMRISKGGYIEVPNGVAELLFPYQSHLWLVFLNHNQLTFVRKSKHLHEVLAAQSDKHFYLTKLLPTPVIHYYWKDTIEFKVINDVKKNEEFFSVRDVKMIQPIYIQKLSIFLGRILRRLFYKKKADKKEFLIYNLKKKAS